LETALAKLDEAIKSNGGEIKNSQADYKVLYAEAKKLGISLEGVTEDVSPENVRILQERMRELAEQGVKPLDDAIE
jgi:ribosomal protein L13E